MPHSSGGGDSGGGSYGGSGSGGGTGFSDVYFPDSHKYMYDKNGKPAYIYTREDMSKRNVKARQIVFWVVAILAAPFVFGMIFLATKFVNLKPMTDTTNTVAVFDYPDVFDESEEAQLKETMDDFYDCTGIAVALMSVSNEDLGSKTLEKYAYDTYIGLYGEDETKWLIVYSADSNGSGKWSWMGMQGDLTDRILTADSTSAFNEEAEGYLMAGDKPGVAFNKALTSYGKTVLKFKPNVNTVLLSIVGGGMVLAAVAMLGGINKFDILGKKLTECPIEEE